MLDAILLEQMDFGGGNSCSAEEYLFLSSLVLLHAPARILEIGTSTGIGALAMAAAGQMFGRPCQVTTIDIPFGSRTFADGLSRNRRLAEAVRPDLCTAIQYISGDSREVLRRFIDEGRTFDFIFIDGDHSEAGVRADWTNALALQPRVVVLHDALHHPGVARVVEELRGRYEHVTFSYPPGHAGGTSIREVGFDATEPQVFRSAAGCPGLTVVTGLRASAGASASAAASHIGASSGHEEADRLVRTGSLPSAQVRHLYGGFRFASTLEQPGLGAGRERLEIVLTGRNDGFGGEDFNQRMFAAAAFNHQLLTEAGIPHTFTLVEWNPVPDRPLLAELIRERLPWWGASYVVSPAWHEKLSENPRLVFMEFFAKNVAIRRSRAEWILTSNTDIFLSPEVVEFLRRGPLVPGTLYRALRIDVDRRVDWRNPTADTFANEAHHLRRNEIEAPYYLNGAGDFLLLDRSSWHALGGFNETVRFAKIYKDGQFCFHAHTHGHPIQPIGKVYHLDHDGSFITATQMYGDRHEEAPFGPWWDAMRSYANRRDWGLSAATERTVDGTPQTRLGTPEESGPDFSFVCNGASETPSLVRAVDRLIEAGDVEVIIANPAPELLASLPATPRIRIAQTAPGENVTAAMNRGLAEASGRVLCCMFRPWSLDADNLGRILTQFRVNPGLAAVTGMTSAWFGPHGERVSEARVSRPGSFAFFRRDCYDHAGELDELATVPELEWWQRLTVGAAVALMPDLQVRVDTAGGGPDEWFTETMLDQAWMAVDHPRDTPGGGMHGMVSSLLVDDFQRRRETLEGAIATRLSAQLSDQDRSVAIWGVGDLTLLLVEAIRRTGRRLSGIYSDQAHGDVVAGVPVRRICELVRDPAVSLVVGVRAAFERVAIHREIPASRIVHVFQPAPVSRAETPEPPPFACLAEARRLRHEGRLDEARDAFARLVGWHDKSDSILYELAELAARTKQHRMVIRLCRHLLRAMSERRGILSQWIASAYQAEGRFGAARRHFTWILDQPDIDPWLRASCHFHLGEMALDEHDLPRAGAHFTDTLELVPGHARAAEYLRRVNARLRTTEAA